jgi:hypothetical protein
MFLEVQGQGAASGGSQVLRQHRASHDKRQEVGMGVWELHPNNCNPNHLPEAPSINTKLGLNFTLNTLQ